jgi:hypothetical protein
MKNKSVKTEKFKSGTQLINSRAWLSVPERNPLSFANSDELRKIQNRNKKKK